MTKIALYNKTATTSGKRGTVGHKWQIYIHDNLPVDGHKLFMVFIFIGNL